MNYIDLIQYKVQNSENNEAFKWAKMTLLTAHNDGFTWVYNNWYAKMNKMVNIDKNGGKISNDCIEDAKYDKRKMYDIIYSKLC